MQPHLRIAATFAAVLTSATLAADNFVTTKINGFPANGELVLPQECSGASCTGDCTWSLTFTATINADDGVDWIKGYVNGVQQIISTTPGQFDCDAENPATVASATFSHDFAVTCEASETSTISFDAGDCDNDTKSDDGKVTLMCEPCPVEGVDQPASYSNGITPLTPDYAGQPFLIQFAVLNGSLDHDLVELQLFGDPAFQLLTELPPMILLPPGQSQIFMVELLAPDMLLPGLAAEFTLGASYPGSTQLSTATALIEIIEPCPADITGDGQVNVDDLVEVFTAWGTGDGAADVNHDGTVDVNDLVEVLTAWGPCDAAL